jgi:hypothetical protein
VKDIQALQRIKERAVRDPEGFGRALEKGDISTRQDPLYNPGEWEDDEDDEEGGGDVEISGVSKDKDKDKNGGKGGKAGKRDKEKVGKGGKVEKEKWEPIPTPQNVVRCPPVNWNQYAIVGESLEKLHRDQVERPSEGVPQRVGVDGVLVGGGEGYGQRRLDLGVAAPYQPGRDKIEKMGTRKGGKR